MQNPISSEKTADLARRMAELGITEVDLLEKFVRGSGAGGQVLQHTRRGQLARTHLDRSHIAFLLHRFGRKNF